jgi:hypothetical protein
MNHSHNFFLFLIFALSISVCFAQDEPSVYDILTGAAQVPAKEEPVKEAPAVEATADDETSATTQNEPSVFDRLKAAAEETAKKNSTGEATATTSTPTASGGDYDGSSFDGGFAMFLFRALMFGTIVLLLLYFENRNEQPLQQVNEAMMLNRRNDSANAFDNRSDDERNEQAAELGQAIIDSWKLINDPDNPGMRTIANRSQAKMTKAKINEIIALAPTSPEVITDLNEIIDIYNVQTRRHSVASQSIITLMALFLVVFGIIGYLTGAFWFALAYGCDFAAYLVAARAPLYLIQNGWGIAPSVFSEMGTAVTAAAIGGLGSYEETKYINPSTGAVVHTETDHTAGFVSLIFLTMLVVFTVCVLPILVLVNVVRNHVIYM